MPTVIELPDSLIERIAVLAKAERRTLEDQIVVYLEQIANAPTAFKRPVEEVTLNELVPLMPKGLRSRASIHRLLKSRAISGKKVRGTWVFNPNKVSADLDQFERVSSISAFIGQGSRKQRNRK